ncbi:MAG: C4-dicarboxylate ABC transporter permease [Deltaproteobacteria bacterium SG8_13]|nr:MAG: C4-dicarboxylate ABC transporter permease [Deltaproteobacteria bacterium SG8_13]
MNRWVEYLLFGLGLSMALVVAMQVFFRYVLNHSLFWSEELARFMLVWLSFLGASAAYKRSLHPGVDILTSRLSAPLRKACSQLVHIVSLVLFTVMIIYGAQFAHFIRAQISPALYLPKWAVFVIIPASGLILAIHCLAFMASAHKDDRRDR